VQILYSEITTAALCGTTWEQLEQYYTVDKDCLKLYFSLPYSKAQAQLQINILDTMVECAVIEKNAVLLKWLSSNWLGMSEKVATVQPTVPVSEDEVNERLKALFEKRGLTIIKDNGETVTKHSATVNSIQ
jgi:hypothetical protein